MCAQRRFRSDCAFAQSDLNLHWALFGYPRKQSFFRGTTKTLIKMRACAGGSVSSLGANANMYVFWRWAAYDINGNRFTSIHLVFFCFFFCFVLFFFISCYQRNFAHVEGKSNPNVVRILNSVLFKVTRRKWYEMNLVLLMMSLVTVKHGSTSSLGPWKCNLDMGSSNHWGLINRSRSGGKWE